MVIRGRSQSRCFDSWITLKSSDTTCGECASRTFFCIQGPQLANTPGRFKPTPPSEAIRLTGIDLRLPSVFLGRKSGWQCYFASLIRISGEDSRTDCVSLHELPQAQVKYPLDQESSNLRAQEYTIENLYRLLMCFEVRLVAPQSTPT